MDELDIIYAKTRPVRKANAMLRQARFELSLNQEKFYLYILSKIPVGEMPDQVEFDMNECARVCGVNFQSGRAYAEMRANLKRLRDSSIYIKNADGSEVTAGLLASVKLARGTSKVLVKFDDPLKPFICNLRENYTEYELQEVLPFRSKYSIRLYECLRSLPVPINGDTLSTTVSLETLRRWVGGECYTTWDLTRRKIVERAVAEFEKHGRLTVTWEPIKNRSGTVTSVRFCTAYKSVVTYLQQAAEAAEIGTKNNPQVVFSDV